MFFVDDYNHVVPNVTYIKESILGPGVDKDDFYSWFSLTCSCSFDQMCIDNRCKCIANTGKNYISSFLTPDKLQNESVFECGAFCSCNFSTCPNRLVQKGPNSRLEIRPVERKGYGLFTLDTIPEGTFICEYAGELVSREVAAVRCQDQANASYILTMREHYGEHVIESHIDAYKFANIGRYVNHSCSPNCTIVPTRAGSIIPKAAIFTTKVVKEGEEITYSYVEGIQGDEGLGSKCYCLSPNCRGFLPVSLNP